MQALTQSDIDLGRAALQRGLITRPQLDEALAVLKAGQVSDLGQALVQKGLLQPAQVAELRPGGPPAGSGWSEQETLHGGGPPQPAGSAPGGWSEAATLHGGPPPAPPGSAVGGPVGGPGSAFGGPGSAFPGSAPGSAFPGGGPGSAFGGPGSAFPGGGPGSAFPGGGPGSAFGAPPGSAPGQWNEGATLHDRPEAATLHDHNAPAGYGGGSGAFGLGSGAHGGMGSGAFGPGSGAFGAPGGSAFGGPVGSGAFGVGGSTFGAGPGTAPGSGGAFGTAPGASGFGGGSAFGFGASPGAMGTPVEEEDAEIGPYTVERELARGGMGVVYLGQKEDGTRAAIKVMLGSGGTVSERKLKRFTREIESTQKLSHPGIVKILDAGEFRGYPYFAMEYIEGKPLDRMLKDDLDLEIGMEILEKIARAVHYAHEEGVIHRDLKPANVIVRDDMEPKLTDFGLAKDRDHQSVLTKTGAVLGTPYYLSPEQASGRSKSIDRRADIYSLGVIMYELATGRLPFVGNTTVELYNRIIHDEPVPPSKIKPQLTKALETVCLKAMAKEPDDRYPTADAFADDIAALLSGGQIKARAEGKALKWAKRVRRRGSLPLVLGGTVFMLASVLGVLVYKYKAREAELHQTAVSDERERIEDRTKQILAEVSEKVSQGRAAVGDGRLTVALKNANDGIEALESIDQLQADLKYAKENAEAVKAFAEEIAPQRKEVTASAYVLRAAATMVNDEEGALAKAQQDLDKVLDEKTGLRPKDAKALIAKAEMHVLKGALEDAATQFEVAAKRMPNSVNAAYGLARVQLLQEKRDDAISSLSRALDLLKSGASEPAAEPAEAEEDVEVEVLGESERRSLRERILVDRAMARLDQSEELDDETYTKIMGDLEAAAKVSPKGWRPLAGEARVHTRRGLLFTALGCFDPAVEKAAKVSEVAKAAALCAKAQGLLDLGVPEAAGSIAEQAVACDSRSLLGLALRAEAEERLLELRDAKTHAKSVVSRAANRKRHWKVHARALRVLARLEGMRGNVTTARKRAKEAVNLDEYGTEGRILLARLELDPHFDGQYLESVDRLLKDVVKLRTDSAEAKLGQGLLMLQKFANDPSRAERKLEDAAKLDPDNPWIRALLAQVYVDVAKRKPELEKDRLAKAARSWGLAYRYERDVRLEAGWAYAVGLRLEKDASLLKGRERAEKLEEALRAYQRATWICPTHTHALTGLTSIALFQKAHRRAGQYLKKAVESNPDSIYVNVLNAYHLASVRGVIEQPNDATKALEDALEKRGETLDLLLRQIFVDQLREDVKAGGESEDLAGRIKQIVERFAELRKRDPLGERILEGELALFTRLQDRARVDATDPERKRMRAFQERLKVVEQELIALRKDLEQRAQEAEKLLERSERKLGQEDALGAVEAADRAARKYPFSAKAWWQLAFANDKAGDLWAALAAGIQAAYLDDDYLNKLFALLRRAGSEPQDEARDKIAAYLKKVHDIYPIHPDVERLMASAPLVARALVIELDSDDKRKADFREAAKETFKQLEDIMNHDPTNLLSHAMVGALAYGVRRYDYALQHLLFLATVRPTLGEAYYLAAVSAAHNHRGSRERNKVLAIRCLQAATRAGFAWEEISQAEGELNRLRGEKIWGHVADDPLAQQKSK